MYVPHGKKPNNIQKFSIKHQTLKEKGSWKLWKCEGVRVELKKKNLSGSFGMKIWENYSQTHEYIKNRKWT